jgi:hypothetical protein
MLRVALPLPLKLSLLTETLPSQREALIANKVDEANREVDRQREEVVSKLVLDPSLDSESVVFGMVNEKQHQLNSTTLVAQQSGARDAGDEGADVETARIDRVAFFERTSEYLAKKQAILNGELLNSGSTAEAVGDFLQLLIPFDESIFTAEVIGKISGGDKSAMAEAIFLLGNSKADLRDYFMNLGFQDRMAFMEGLANVVNSSSGIVFTNDNDMAQKDLFMSVVDGGYYGDFEQGLDNVISILDMVGLGGIIRAGARGAKATKLGTATADLGRIIKSRVMRSDAQPTAPIKVVTEANPEEAKTLHAQTVLDESDVSSNAIYGTNRDEAVVDAHAPQPRNEEGIVEGKIFDPDQKVREIDMASGNIDLSVEELSAAMKATENSLNRVGSLTLRENESLPATKIDDTSFEYTNTYGPGDGVFTDAKNAIESTLFAFRSQGITGDNLTLMQKVGNEYVPTTLKEVEAKEALRAEYVRKRKKLPDELKRNSLLKDYLVQVKAKKDVDLYNIEYDKNLEVKWNVFDRIVNFISGNKGDSSLSRNLLDPQSMLAPHITKAASVSVDRAAALEKSLTNVAERFSTPYAKLPSERQELIQSIIKDQNYQEKYFSYKELKAMGVQDEEMGMLKAWKETWDNIWWLENKDLVKTLKASGYQRYIDTVNKTDLVARPIGKKTALNNVVKVYNPATGKVEGLTSDAVEALYDGGGTVSKTRQTEELDGKVFDYVIAENQIGKSHMRELLDTDHILAYKEGYYTVRYKDPHFIEKQWVDGVTGKPTRTMALKTASNVKDAELIADNYNKANKESGVRYISRSNKDLSSQELEDSLWSIQTNSGRTSQRLRGERLKTVDTDLADNSLGAIQGPVEALLNSARSISRRSSMRDFIERYKLRYMEQYGDMLPSDGMGGVRMPRNSAEIDASVQGRDTSKRAADARTNLEYLHSLEYGYRNSIDDVYKALLNGMGDALGKYSKTAEKGVRAIGEEIVSPTAWFRGRAFESYLALNPLRQFIVQAHQATMLTANFHKYVVSQKLAQEMNAVYLATLMGPNLKKVKGVEKLMGMSVDDAIKLREDYLKTGLHDAIDKNNLIEGGLDQLVETTRFAGAKKFHKSVVTRVRKAGFDAGESINMLSAWLAHRNRALEKDLDVTSKRVADDITAQARNYTYNMNQAGEMPYNKNSLSLIFQFMQVPHKAMTQIAFNRQLTFAEKSNLALYNAVMLPLPAGVMTTWLSTLLPEDETTREIIVDGFEAYTFNMLARSMFDDDTRVDFSSITAIDPYAPIDLITGILTSDIGKILSSSPSLQLVSGYNPRITNIVRGVNDIITAPTEVDAKKLGDLALTFANYSSGVANFSQSFKELYLQEYTKRYNSSGSIVDPSITTPEMVAKAFGFGTATEKFDRLVKQSVYEESQDAKSDVKEFYRVLTQVAARRGLNVDDKEWSTEIMREFFRGREFTIGQREEFMRLMKADMMKGRYGAMDVLLKSTRHVPSDRLREIISGTEQDPRLEEHLDRLRELGDNKW